MSQGLTITPSLAAGFTRPVFEAQSAFRAAMDALSRPGSVIALSSDLAPPAPLTPAAAALALALLDFEVSFHLAPSLSGGDVGQYLRFHTGAREASSASEADFVLLDLAADPLSLATLKAGEPAYPDRAATVLALVASVNQTQGLSLAGPGIKAVSTLGVAPLPPDFSAQWQANHARYPLGVDIVFAAPQAVLGLPRSARILAGER